MWGLELSEHMCSGLALLKRIIVHASHDQGWEADNQSSSDESCSGFWPKQLEYQPQYLKPSSPRQKLAPTNPVM